MNIAKFKGVPVRIGEEVCLTDMWKAAKGSVSQHPKFWVGNENTKALMKELGRKVTPGNLFRAERGRYGGTWAHWQLGLAYARYLSPKFEVWCNDVLKGFINAEADVAESIIERNDNAEELARIESRAHSKRAFIDLRTAMTGRGCVRDTFRFTAAQNCRAITGRYPSEIRKGNNAKARSVRDLLEANDLGLIAGLEALEAVALNSNQTARGHNKVMRILDGVRTDFSSLLSKYATSPSAA